MRYLMMLTLLLGACEETSETTETEPAAPPAEAEPAEPAAPAAEEPAGPLADVVKANAATLKQCYESRLAEKPDLAGKVVAGWTVAEGKASNVRTVENTTGDDALATCLTEQVSGWTFPAEVTGEVQWPFVFQPSAAAPAAGEPAAPAAGEPAPPAGH